MAVQQPPNLTRSEALELLVYVSGYRPAEIARKIGITSSALRNGLTGRFDLSEDRIKEICRFLHVLPERVLALPNGEWVDETKETK